MPLLLNQAAIYLTQLADTSDFVKFPIFSESRVKLLNLLVDYFLNVVGLLSNRASVDIPISLDYSVTKLAKEGEANEENKIPLLYSNSFCLLCL